jgi:hypothetical protein
MAEGKLMQLDEGKAYIDREGNVWDCTQHSVYDEGWTWCRSRRDGLAGLFGPDGSYLYRGEPHPFDLIAEAQG